MADQSTAPPTDFAEMAAPTDAHKRFEPFVGTWKAEVRMWMGPGDPHVSTGTMTNTKDLGGRFLRQDYVGDAGGPFPEFEGRGFWGFNKTAGRYEGVWIDNASTMMQTDAGDVDASGKVWTMVGEMTCPGTNQPMQKKSVITLVDDDHHTMEMFFTGPDGNETKSMEIRYERP